MALGEADAQSRRQEILDFMEWSVVQGPVAEPKPLAASL